MSSYSAIVGVWRWTGSDFSLDPSLKFDLYRSVNPVEVTIKSVTRPGPHVTAQRRLSFFTWRPSSIRI